MPFTKIKGIGSGRVMTAGDLNGSQPVVSEPFNVQTLDTISCGLSYTRGVGSSVSRYDVSVEVSYDDGATWLAVAINIDRGTPPVLTVEPGSIRRNVSADDAIAVGGTDVSAFALMRLSVVTTGATVAGDLMDIDVLGLMSGSIGLSGSHAGQDA